MEFKDFLINENKTLFSQRLGDILNALQELSSDPKSIGKKENVKIIANQIRSNFLRGQKWPGDLKYQIKMLITIAVNLLKSVDPQVENRPDMDAVINSSIKNIEQMSKKLSIPNNQLASQE